MVRRAIGQVIGADLGAEILDFLRHVKDAESISQLMALRQRGLAQIGVIKRRQADRIGQDKEGGLILFLDGRQTFFEIGLG